MSGFESLMALLRGRRSVRRFRDEPVDPSTIDRLIEAASWAPSAGNRQDWLFTVVASSKARETMQTSIRRRVEAATAERGGTGTLAELARYVGTWSDITLAPALILVSARGTDAVQRRLFGEAAEAGGGGAASAAMAAQNLMLAAHALGLGTCCMTGPLIAAEDLGRMAGLPPRHRIVCLVTVGHPAETPPAPPRKPVPDISRHLA